MSETYLAAQPNQNSICARCKQHNSETRYKLCVKCREELRANTQKKRDDAIAKGLCIRCHKQPAIPSLRNCGECNDKENARSKRKAEKAKANNRCVACGKPPELGKKKCTECLAKAIESAARTHQQQTEGGRCNVCGRENDRLPKKMCSPCHAKYKKRRDKLKIDAFDAYGGPVCRCCGETIFEFLTMGHVANDGADHRRRIAAEGSKYRRNSTGWIPKSNGQGVSIYRWLKHNNYPQGNFQVLCMNCNFAKGKYEKCPHETMQAQIDGMLTKLAMRLG